MEYTHLGRTGLTVSRLVPRHHELRTADRASPTRHAIMDRAHEHGINFFDTANVYGWAEGEGRTEQIVGRWFAQGGGRREKDGPRHQALRRRWATGPTTASCPRCNIRRACDASPEAAADRLHRPLPDAPRRPGHAVGGDLAGDRGPACSRARSSTSARRNFAGWHIAQAQEAAAAGTSSASCQRAVASTTCSPATSSWRCSRPRRHYGLGVIPWSPAARRAARRRAARSSEGGAARGPRQGGARDAPRRRSRRTRTLVRRARRGARRRRPRLAAAPARRHRPDRRPAHGGAAGRRLACPGRHRSSDRTLDRLDEIFPGSSAPEDYAW